VHRYFSEENVFRIDHYLGKNTVQNLLFFRFANSFLEPVWNSPVRRQRPDHDGGELRRRGPWQVLRPDGRPARRRAEPPAASPDEHRAWNRRRAWMPRC
jgi:hypothetical protein